MLLTQPHLLPLPQTIGKRMKLLKGRNDAEAASVVVLALQAEVVELGLLLPTMHFV